VRCVLYVFRIVSKTKRLGNETNWVTRGLQKWWRWISAKQNETQIRFEFCLDALKKWLAGQALAPRSFSSTFRVSSFNEVVYHSDSTLPVAADAAPYCRGLRPGRRGEKEALTHFLATIPSQGRTIIDRIFYLLRRFFQSRASIPEQTCEMKMCVETYENNTKWLQTKFTDAFIYFLISVDAWFGNDPSQDTESC
jgi:hypothetical protein